MTILVLDGNGDPQTIKTIDDLIVALAGGTAGTPGGDVQSVQGIEGAFPLSVTNTAYLSTVSFSRPADAGAFDYTANDAIGINNVGAPGSAVHQFASIGPDDGGHVLLTTSTLRIDKSTVPSGQTSFRLEFYSASPPSLLLDNEPWDLAVADRSTYLGYLDLGTPVDRGSTLYVEGYAGKHIFVPEGGILYAYLVTNGGFTPANSTSYSLRLFSIGI